MNGLPGLNLRLWLTYLDKQQDIFTTFVCSSNMAGCDETKKMHPRIRVLDISHYRHKLLALFWNIFRESYDLLLVQGLYNVKLNILLFNLVRAQRKLVIIWNASSHQEIVEKPNKLSSWLHQRMLQRSDGILFTWKPTQDAFIQMFPDLAAKTTCFNWGFSEEYFDLDFAPQSELTDQLLTNVNSEAILLFFPRLLQSYHRHDVFIRSLPIVKKVLPPEIWDRIQVIILGGECSKQQADPLIDLIAHTNLPNIRFHWGNYIARDFMWKIYNRANILVNLSDEDAQPGGAIFEAAARNTHLVLSDTNAYKHFRELGFDCLLVSNDPVKVADELASLIIGLDTKNSVRSLEHNRKLISTLYGPSQWDVFYSGCFR